MASNSSSPDNFQQPEAAGSSWCFRPSSFNDDYALITRALQMSFSPVLHDQSPTPPPPILNITPSGSDPDTLPPPPKRRRIPVRTTKLRKSRASKRSNTTFITADPSNFRQMVQQVTGVRTPHQLPTLLKPEPHRPTILPTLDTSEYLLDYQQLLQQEEEFTPTHHRASDVAGFLHFPAASSLPVFPTLESWEVMSS